MVQLLASTQKVLKSGDDRAMLAALAAVEATHRTEDYESSPVYKAAVVKRKQIRRGEAIEELAQDLVAAETVLIGDGDWHIAARNHAEMEAKIARYSIIPDESQQSRLDEIGAQLDRLRREAKRKAEVKRVLVTLRQVAEDVELHSVTPAGIDPAFATKNLDLLLKNYRRLEDLRAEPSSSDTVRIDAARGQLEQILERKRRSKKARYITLSSVAVIVLLSAAVYGWFSLQASESVKRLAQLERDGQSKALTEQVKIIRDSKPVLMRFSDVQAQLVISEQWLKDAQGSSSKVGELMAKLELDSKIDFANTSPEEAYNRLREVEKLMVKLPADLSGEMGTRFTITSNEIDRYLTSYQKSVSDKANAILDEAEQKLADINMSGGASLAKGSMEIVVEQLKPYIALKNKEILSLRLPALTETRVNDVDARVRHILNKADQALKAYADLEKVVTLDEYVNALAILSGENFIEASRAQRVTDSYPSENSLRSWLFFKGDLTALATAKKTKLKAVYLPREASKSDREVVKDLSTNSSLTNLHEVNWTKNGDPQQVVYSQGRLKVTRGELDSAGNLKVTSGLTWSGKIARRPTRQGQSLEFKELYLRTRTGSILTGNNLSETSKLIDALGLDLVLDDTGSEYRRSIIPLVDRVFQDKNAPALAKAYIINSLFRLLRGREHEWGIKLAPALLEDMRLAFELELKSPVRAGDWLYEKSTKMRSEWEAFFATRKSRDHYTKLSATRSLAKAGVIVPIILAGVAGADGSATITPNEDFRIILGLCLDADGVETLKLIGEVKASAEHKSPAHSLLPLSPIYSIQLEKDADRKQLMKTHWINRE